jgi:hypothetical protein
MERLEPDHPETDVEASEPDVVDTEAETSATAPAGDVSDGEETKIRYQGIGEWHGKKLVDRNGKTIGRLDQVYFDVETDEPQFGTFKEGFVVQHLAFVPLQGVTIGPDSLQVAVSRGEIRGAPTMKQEGDELSEADESALYHHYKLNYTPTETTSGRRLVRH